MSHAIDQSFSEAALRLDTIRAVLAFLNSTDVKQAPRTEVAWASQKAVVYVWLAACIEDFVKRFLRLLLQDISIQNLKCQQVRVELLAIAGGSVFDRLQDLRQLKKWRERVAVLKQVVDIQDAILPEAHLPLDGRTIQPEHLDVVWLVFGFPHGPFPGPVQKMALLDVSRGRNQVAHGEIKPEDLGRSKTITDLQRLVSHMEDLVQHVYMCGLEYLGSSGFLR
jgi:hypothetical protein